MEIRYKIDTDFCKGLSEITTGCPTKLFKGILLRPEIHHGFYQYEMKYSNAS